MCLVIQIENYIYEIYFVEHFCVLGWENHLTFGLLVKESEFDHYECCGMGHNCVYVLRRGCLGT